MARRRRIDNTQPADTTPQTASNPPQSEHPAIAAGQMGGGGPTLPVGVPAGGGSTAASAGAPSGAVAPLSQTPVMAAGAPVPSVFVAAPATVATMAAPVLAPAPSGTADAASVLARAPSGTANAVRAGVRHVTFAAPSAPHVPPALPVPPALLVPSTSARTVCNGSRNLNHVEKFSSGPQQYLKFRGTLDTALRFWISEDVRPKHLGLLALIDDDATWHSRSAAVRAQASNDLYADLVLTTEGPAAAVVRTHEITRDGRGAWEQLSRQPLIQIGLLTNSKEKLLFPVVYGHSDASRLPEFCGNIRQLRTELTLLGKPPSDAKILTDMEQSLKSHRDQGVRDLWQNAQLFAQRQVPALSFTDLCHVLTCVEHESLLLLQNAQRINTSLDRALTDFELPGQSGHGTQSGGVKRDHRGAEKPAPKQNQQSAMPISDLRSLLGRCATGELSSEECLLTLAGRVDDRKPRKKGGRAKNRDRDRRQQPPPGALRGRLAERLKHNRGSHHRDSHDGDSQEQPRNKHKSAHGGGKKFRMLFLADEPGDADATLAAASTSNPTPAYRILVDSGASSHAFPPDDPRVSDRRALKAPLTYTLADGTKDSVSEVGTATVDLTTGDTLELSNVLLVHAAPIALLSLSKLIDSGATVLFKETHASVRLGQEQFSLPRDPASGLFYVPDRESS